MVYTEYDVYGRPTKTGFVLNLTSTSISNTLTETFYKTTAGAGFGQPYKTTAALLNNNGAPTTDFIAREITTFDTYHRPTEFKSNHPLSLTDLSAITGQTAFNGLDQATSLTTNITISATTYSTTQSHLYDHGARLKKRDFSFNNTTVTADEITSFDAFDNPLQTKIGGNLQTVDYSYLPNGFLDQINGGGVTGNIGLTSNSIPSENSTADLFAMDLDYQSNGNISSWKIQNRGFSALTHSYGYDGLQRIISASNGTQQETFTYRDPLGNFSSIVRTDLVKSAGNWVSQSVDNLTFAYANTKTNRISSIADASNNTVGYVPNNGTYSYDANGNATFDPSRGLNLTNNFLNLPSKFTKADGSRQEIIHDASGKKWQEKTYGVNNGALLGQKTYLAGMEFEGNELSLVHHPTGFIRKLNSANHLSGTQNGDAQGKSISSTQKIGEGRYTATDQVTLLPGFEASAKDKFLAKIGTVNTYQWQYVLTDHLGNQRALFTDKNEDGLLRQSTDETQNEVLALRNYSAFGLELGGSNQNTNYQNAYKYTGKEENSFTGYYDFGARWADPTVGNRFLQIDPLASIIPGFSPMVYGFNNPLRYIDPDGRMAEDCCGDNEMSLVENVYWSTRDAVVSSIVTLASSIGSLFSNDIKPQKVNVSYSGGSRTLSKEAIPSDEVAGEVLGSALIIASAVPSGGSAGAGVFMAKTGTGASTVSSVLSAAKEAKGGVYALKDGETVVRTGRTKVLIRREMEHANDPVLKKYEFETKHKTDNYAEQRGLEYKVSKQHESTASKANGGHNKINAINEKNPNKPIYIQAAEDYLKRQ